MSLPAFFYRPSQLDQYRSFAAPVGRSGRASDNSFATARRIGVLRASRTPTTLSYRGQLTSQDRVDFIRLDIAPGARFSGSREIGRVRGGRLRTTNYVEIPGQPRQKVLTVTYKPRPFREQSSSPFANNFGVTVRLYVEIRSLSRSPVSYQSKATYFP
jgi:hypothetical protein